MVTSKQVADKLNEVGNRQDVPNTIRETTGLEYNELIQVTSGFAPNAESTAYLLYGLIVGMQLGTSVPMNAIRTDHSW